MIRAEVWVCALLLLSCGARSSAPTSAAPPRSPAALARTLRGSDLALRSTGVTENGAWRLPQSGFVGNYLRVDALGTVTLSLDATAVKAAARAPRVRLVIADAEQLFELGDAPGERQLRVQLPIGTYLARVDFVRAAPGDALLVKQLALHGATWLPGNTDQHALSAANTYIDEFRRGRAALQLPLDLAGKRAQVRLERHAFGFGANIPRADNQLIPDGPLSEDQERFQRLLLENFNWAVLSNGGKWAYQEPERDVVDMGYVDRFLEFCQQYGLSARMHNLIWDTEQQPTWIMSKDEQAPGLLTRAAAGDAAAKRELLEEIDERIAYYVRGRSQRYLELDVLNESLHRPRYFQVLGEVGVAELFRKVKKAASPDTRLYLNEFNVLQFSEDPLAREKRPDPFANWYRWHAEALLAAGAPIDGLGVQYYADVRGADELGDNVHSAARIAAVLHNLSGTGLRLTLSEFEVRPRPAPVERGPDMLEQTLRLVFGTPHADAFLIWAIWAKQAQTPAPLSLLLDDANELTPAGWRYKALMREWSTALELPIAQGGKVELVGFFGDYSVRVDGELLCFSLTKGRTEYTPLPPASGSCTR
jgi:GH35 family endo-1,4-beta-xylanase